MPADLPCVLDIEASGFGRGSYPIEVGFALPNGAGWCSLVQPQPAWQHWDAQAEQVHGIGRHTLLLHGRPAQEVAARLNAALAGCVVYSDGWAHDYTWLAQLFDAADLVPRFKLASVRELVPDELLPQLDRWRTQAHQSLGIDRHRASSDARALQWAVSQLLASATRAA